MSIVHSMRRSKKSPDVAKPDEWDMSNLAGNMQYRRSPVRSYALSHKLRNSAQRTHSIANIFIGGDSTTKRIATTVDYDTLRMLSESPPRDTKRGSCYTANIDPVGAQWADIFGGFDVLLVGDNHTSDNRASDNRADDFDVFAATIPDDEPNTESDDELDESDDEPDDELDDEPDNDSAGEPEDFFDVGHDEAAVDESDDESDDEPDDESDSSSGGDIPDTARGGHDELVGDADYDELHMFDSDVKEPTNITVPSTDLFGGCFYALEDMLRADLYDGGNAPLRTPTLADEFKNAALIAQIKVGT